MSERPTTRTRVFLSVARDVVSYVLGWLMMDSQAGILSAPPVHPNETAMWIAALLIGVPGVAQVIALRFGGTGSTQPQSAGALSPASPSSSPAEPSPGGEPA